MNETENPPIAQKVTQTFRQLYDEKKDAVGYPFLEWSGRIIAMFAYLSLVVTGLIIYSVLSASDRSISENEKVLYVFISAVSGIVAFILMKGLSSASYLLLDLWKNKKQ
jgi:hypothetical protein